MSGAAKEGGPGGRPSQPLPPRLASVYQDDQPAGVDAATQCLRCCSACCSAIGWIFSSCLAWMRQLPTRHIDFILRVVNICNALLLGVGAYLAFDDAYGWAFQAATGLCFKCDAELNPPCGNAFILVPRVFLGTYIVLFALLIIAFETRTKTTAVWIKHYFGFVFTPIGRGMSLMFCGTVCFGLVGDVVIPPTDLMLCIQGSALYIGGIFIGIATTANATFNLIILCIHPEFGLDTGEPEPPRPFSPAELSDADIKSFLAKHPDIAANALAMSRHVHQA